MKRIVIIGNPNSGKTTLFNKLTGKNQHVGNWPGITIDKKVGTFTYNGEKFEIVDLPGIYSLSPYTSEEVIAREYIIDNKPDLILNIVDALSLERNLYLSLQLKSLEIPMLTTVNFIDDAKAENIDIDISLLSEKIGIKCIAISAKKGLNIDLLLNELSSKPQNIYTGNSYEKNIVDALSKINNLISDKTEYSNFYSEKLLQGEKIKALNLDSNTYKQIDEIVLNINTTLDDREMIMADCIYSAIEKIVKSCVVREYKIGISEKIDKIVTNKYLAIPIFGLIMFTMFSFTFGSFGSYFSDLLDVLINENLASLLSGILINTPQWFSGLILNGILAGVGGILTFLPQILILFFFLGILEDSGYLARIAFIMDAFLRKIGLSGKSFIPMLMGFGCTTPAVMASRTMQTQEERKMTILLTPFMSCSAKLPVYALFIGAFFNNHQGIITFSIYILGIFVGIISGFIFKATIFKGINGNFVLEIPKYRMPSLIATFKNMYIRAKDFVIKAGTIIFAMSVLIWFAQNFTFSLSMTTDTSNSILGIIGSFIAPIFTPLGFGTWEASVSLLTGLIAKESVVSTMGVLYTSGADIQTLTQTLQGIFTPLAGYSFMAFTLLYVPCISAFATIKREIGSMKWALWAAGYQILSAYVVSFIIFNIGSLFL